MMERATTTENPEPLVGPPIPEGTDSPVDPLPPAPAEEPPSPRASRRTIRALEERVQRLEDALAQMQDTQPLETRIVSRVLEKVGSDRPAVAPTPASSGAVRESAALMLDAGRQLSAAAVGALQAQASAVEARALVAPTTPTAQPWLIVDLWADVRTLFRMSRDPLYRTAWLGRALLPLGLLGLIFSSWLWLHLVPGYSLLMQISETLARLLIAIVNLLLAFVLCKVLQREIRRYREVLSGASRRP